MRAWRRARYRALIAITLFLGVGCVQISSLEPADVVAGLSGLILRPEITCTQLREWFQVNYLPVVENPAEAGLDYEEHRLPLDARRALRLWYLPTNLDRGTVVYSMGTSGFMACYLFSAELLTRNGWSVVMYEYEGFGRSDGTPALDTLARDLLAVVQWTRGYSGRDQVTLMGMSLGSIPSVTIAVEHPNLVNAVILDSPISLTTQIERFGFLVGGQSRQLIERLDVELLSEELITRLQQPLLIFSHGLDIIATPTGVESLFQQAAGPKQIVRFPGIGHACGQFVYTDIYIYYLETFLTEVWAAPAEEQEPVPGRHAPLR